METCLWRHTVENQELSVTFCYIAGSRLHEDPTPQIFVVVVVLILVHVSGSQEL